MAALAVAMFLVYTWSLYISFWKFPSWLLSLRLDQILSIYTYSFVTNFIESLLLISIPLLVSLLLPARWWKEAFIARASLVIVIVFASALIHINLYGSPDTREMFVKTQVPWWLGTFLLIVLLSWLSGRVTFLRTALESLADRLTVFLYIYLPLTALAAILLAARLLF